MIVIVGASMIDVIWKAVLILILSLQPGIAKTLWVAGNEKDSYGVEIFGSEEGAVFRLHRGKKKNRIQPFEDSYLDTDLVRVVEIQGRPYLIGVWMTGQRARSLSVTDLKGDLKKPVFTLNSVSEMSFVVLKDGIEILYSTVKSEDDGVGAIRFLWEP